MLVTSQSTMTFAIQISIGQYLPLTALSEIILYVNGPIALYWWTSAVKELLLLASIVSCKSKLWNLVSCEDLYKIGFLVFFEYT